MTAKLYARDGGTAGASDIEITDVAPFFDDNNVPLIQLGNAAQNGSASQGYFQVQDPTSALIQSTGLWLPPHTRILWTEDATGDELWLAYGRVVGGERGRGDVKGADNIEHHWTVDDANVDLRGLAFTEDWVRPIETDTERLYALQAYILNGASSTSPTFRPSTVITVADDHLAPDTNTYLMPAKTFPAGTQPQEVVDDCTSSSGKVYGVVPHHTGGTSHLCLLYIIETDHSTFASTVKISDKVANCDPEDLTAPVFEPIWDQGMAVVKDDESAISGLVNRYGVGSQFVYVNEPSQEDDYEHWIDVYNDADSKTLAQATARATAIRSYRAAGNATFRVTVLMLAEQHTLLGAGMSLQIDTAPILGGYYRGTYIDARIVTCSWEPLPDGRYWAHLELNRGRRGAGSGKVQPAATTPDGALVSPCPCIETFNRVVAANGAGLSDLNLQNWVVDSVTGSVSVDGAEAVIDRANLHLPITGAMDNSRFELLYKARFEGPTPADPRGTLDIDWVHNSGIGPLAGARVRVRARETGSTDTELAVDVTFIEEGVGVGGGFDFGTQLIYPYVSGGEDFWVHISVDHNTLNGNIWLDADPEPFGWMFTLNNSPTCNYNNTNGLVDTMHIYTTNTSTSSWHIDQIQILAGMWCCDGTPASGQYVNDISVGYGDGSTTVFNAPTAAYVPGTLRVWVDGLEQTAAITESDPSTGEFTFSFTPQASELITVSYQVA